MKYFIIINGAQQGPFSLAELQQKGLSSDTLVWAEGMAEWTPAWQVEELRPIFYKQDAGAAMPPPPPVNPGVGGTMAGQSVAGNPGAQTANAAYQPKKPQHNGLWIVIVLVVVAGVLALTNPSEAAHKRAIISNISNGLGKAAGTNDGSLLSQGLGMIGQVFGQGLATMVLDQNLQYNNYLLFSTTTLHVGPKEVRASVGFLGNVFTADEDKVAKSLREAFADESRGDGDNADDAVTENQSDPDQDVQVQRNEQDTTLTDADGRAIGRAVVKEVTKTVRQKVDESTDSTTSSGIGHIIDEIEKMIGIE